MDMSPKYIKASVYGKIIPIEELGNGHFSVYGVEFCIKFYETHPLFNDILVSIFTINAPTGFQFGTIYCLTDFELYFASHYDMVYTGYDPVAAAAKLIAEV